MRMSRTLAMGRRAFVAAMLASAGRARGQTPATPPAEAPSAQLVDDLVSANRILADQGVLDGFGHVSARHDKRPDRFLLARSMAPGLVTAADLMTFDLDGAATGGDTRTAYLERFIHSAIYRARPDVMAVAHSHSASVLPFSVTQTPLKPLYHMAGFLGGGAPVFEVRDAAGPDSDLLIGAPALGAALAARLGKASVVLIRGHGWVATGASVRTAVLHAVYTEIDARAEAEALRLGPVTFLNEAEAARTAAVNDRQVDRPWALWRARAMGGVGPR
jgi:HCOMODA/2-hydroxy-3-carboxy-muconic semialdehyde decarboxylase